MFRHIVLFRVHDGVSDERVTAALDGLRSLAVLPGVVGWRVELSLDERKGRIIVEDATFLDAASFESFRTHPRHVEVAEAMSNIADWWNGDYAACRKTDADAFGAGRSSTCSTTGAVADAVAESAQPIDS